jgi:hypothetical protein
MAAPQNVTGQEQPITKFTCCAPRIASPCCGARPYAPKIAALAGREVDWRAREALRANALRARVNPDFDFTQPRAHFR